MRRFGRFLALAVIVACAGISAGCGKSHVAIPISWHVDIESAAASAKAQNKPLFVFVGADWDMGSKVIERDTLGDVEVRRLLERELVSILVDATDDENPRTRAGLQRFQVLGTPTLIILAPDGMSEIARFNEVIPAKVLARALRAALI
jgi:thioredoxin:protein disulfide reductase